MDGETPLADETLEPFKTIWTQPRRTVRWIVGTDPRRLVLPLAAASGVGEMLDRCSSKNVGDRLSLGAILGLALLAGPLMGLIQLHLGAWLVSRTGKWLGGQAEPLHVRAAFAWASVPVIVASVFWLPELALAGREMFTSATPGLDAAPGRAMAVVVLSMIEASLGIWAFVIMLKGLAEVQGFSAWKALGNMALAGVVVLVPVFTLAALLAAVIPNLAG